MEIRKKKKTNLCHIQVQERYYLKEKAPTKLRTKKDVSYDLIKFSFCWLPTARTLGTIKETEVHYMHAAWGPVVAFPVQTAEAEVPTLFHSWSQNRWRLGRRHHQSHLHPGVSVTALPTYLGDSDGNVTHAVMRCHEVARSQATCRCGQYRSPVSRLVWTDW